MEDVAFVDPAEKPYVRDIESIEDLNADMLEVMGRKAMLYDYRYSVENQTVTLREANNGFDSVIPLIYSAEGVVSDTVVEADISLAVFTG